MEKELRKSLRGVLDKVHGADLALDEIMTKENSEILAKYPVKEGAWNHPNSHYLLRIKEFLTVSKKTLERVIAALPKERKSKNDKKVVWEDKNNEQAKTAKAPRSSKGNPGSKKRDRKPKNEAGADGSDSKLSGGGVQPEVQRTRKRGRPPKQK